MAVADEATKTIKGFIPQISGISLINISLLIIGIIFVLALTGVGIYFIIRRRRYNKEIIIFEEINNRYEPTKRDRAMEFKVGDVGDRVLYLSKNKKYLPMPSIQTGRNVYWYAIREDGEWINIGVEDIDFSMREAKAFYLDKEMRYARVGLNEAIKEKYNKTNWFAEHAGLLVNLAVVVIIMVFLWLIVSKQITLASTVNEGIGTTNTVLEKLDSILGKMDSICTGGSGYKPAG